MFGRKGKEPKSEPVTAEAGEATAPAPINGALGGSSRVRASKKKMIWWTIIVIAVVLAIANKVIHKPHPVAPVATQGALPMEPATAPSAQTNPSRPALPTNGGLPTAIPAKSIHTAPLSTLPSTVRTPESLSVVQGLIAEASGDTATVVQTWPGPGGFTGVIYRDANHARGIAWVDPTKSLVLLGTLVGSDGKNYNTAADFSLAATQAPKTSKASPVSSKETGSGSLRSLLSGGTGFVVGNRGPMVTAYIDPNSLASHRLYVGLESAVEANKVRVRYVLIAVKNKGSIKKAEEILSAPSPAKELSVDERLGKQRATGVWTGGIPGIQGSLSMAQQVDENTAILAAAGYVGDPALVYCTKQGKPAVATNDGAVGDLSAILANVGNCQ